jgi:hypothetical protein
MTEADIEREAEGVLLAHDLGSPPVDPFHIARLEKIALLPGRYDGCFDGRIEYRRTSRQGRFLLFYAEPEPGLRPEGRVRFSVAHELAHFYLPHHRDYLLSGRWHGSRSGFVSERPVEREADQFAAALLLPRRQFMDRIRRKNFRCDLSDLLHFADEVFHTSVVSTVIRYVQMDVEQCCVVLSRQGHTLFSLRSAEMKRIGLGWVERDSPVPSGSVTARLVRSAQDVGASRAEGTTESEVWFETGRRGPLWEEAMLLGRSGLALSFLVVDADEDESD